MNLYLTGSAAVSRRVLISSVYLCLHSHSHFAFAFVFTFVSVLVVVVGFVVVVGTVDK